MDIADLVQERQEREDAMRFTLAALGYRAGLDQRVSGECDECGEPSIRLVGGCCARCLDLTAREAGRRIGDAWMWNEDEF